MAHDIDDTSSTGGKGVRKLGRDGVKSKVRSLTQTPEEAQTKSESLLSPREASQSGNQTCGTIGKQEALLTRRKEE
jgi:hypothetical protein